MQFIDNVVGMDAGRHIIINRLRMYRRQKGYTQAYVALLLGLKDKCEVSRWERGITQPNNDNLFKLAIIYGRLSEDLYRERFKDLQREIEERKKVVALSCDQKSNEKKHKRDLSLIHI